MTKADLLWIDGIGEPTAAKLIADGITTGQWDERVSSLIIASEIISEFAFPGATGNEPEGIYYDWDVNGEGLAGNYLRWITDYPPKEQTGNEEHQIKVGSGLTGIPDGSSTSTSDYDASWTVNLGSLSSPSSMSNREMKKYGIEKIPASEASVASAGDVSTVSVASTEPIYRATSPVTVSQDDSRVLKLSHSLE